MSTPPGSGSPPAPDRRARAAPLHRAVLAQTRLELVLLLRSGESLLVTLGIPLGILVLFSGVEVLPTGDREPVDFLVPGVLAISVLSTALVALAIQTAFQRKYGVLKRLGATPLPRGGFLAAKALAVIAVLAVQTVLVLAVAAWGLGWQPTGAVGALAAGLVAGTLTFSAAGLLLAGTLSAEATLATVNAAYLVLLVVSGLVFEAGALPGPLETVGAALPAGALGEVLREALDQPGRLAAGPLALLAAWGAAAAAVAARTFRWEP